MPRFRTVAFAFIAASAPVIGYFYQQEQMALSAVRAANLNATANSLGNLASGQSRRAVVVGATSGIGRAIAVRLAQAEFDVVAVGRDTQRGAEVVSEMKTVNGKGKHEFVSLDGSLLSNAYKFANTFVKDDTKLDVLVLTQGFGSLNGRTETAEGIDKKLAVHYFGRMAFVDALLPALRKANSARVLTVLSAGVHSEYSHWKDDFELKTHFSIKNAADAAGFYNDIGTESLSRDPANKDITFIHAAPGGVATGWGQGQDGFPWYIQPLLKLAKNFVKSPADCAEFMVAPILNSSEPYGQASGWRLIGSQAQVVKATKGHEEAREFVWAQTNEMLAAARERAGPSKLQ